MTHRSIFYCLFILLPFFAKADPAIEFIENKGQWKLDFLYKASNSSTDIYLEKKGIVYVIQSPDNPRFVGHHLTGNPPYIFKMHAYRMALEGANDVHLMPSKIQPHYYNYFLGNDPNRWKSGIHPAQSVDYGNIYNNIDLHISSENSRLKYDFIVKAGADISQIKLRYEGTEGLSIRNNNLQIMTSVGKVEELKPFAYQYIDGERKEVLCRYRIKDTIVTYDFPDGYDTTQQLIIDPVVVFATFTGSQADNWGFTATYDAAGNFYAGGIVTNTDGAAVNPQQRSYILVGAYQNTYGGGNSINGFPYPSDMSITKFNATGNNVIYSTYLGGADNEQPHSLIVDHNGDLVIAGKTYSKNFPVTAGCFRDTNTGGADMVISKFDASGSTLLASTYVGGSSDDVVNITSSEPVLSKLKHNYGDDSRSEVVVDNQNNIYVAACTQSKNFPTTLVSALKNTLGVGDTQDAVVIKMNSTLTTMTWGTYLGGSNFDAAYVLTLDTSQKQLFVAGGTLSSNFPTTSGSFISSFQGGIDGFICRFQNGGNYPLQKSTIIGYPSNDQCYGVQVDAENDVYAMGQSLGGFFPISPGVYSNPNSSQFVIKLNNDLSTRISSTVFGSGNPNLTNMSPVAFLVDTCENIYISGWGGNSVPTDNYTGTVQNMPLSAAPNPPTQSTTDNNDFYFFVLSKNMLVLQYASYLGGTGPVSEHVDGGTSRFDRNGVVYQAICGGCGASSSFPVTGNVVSPTNNSRNCNLIAVKIAFNLGAVKAVAQAYPDASVCIGETIQFGNTSANATSYEWDFGDGSPINKTATPTHAYSSVGTFSVKMVAINPNACKVRDTVYLTIKADTNTINSAFSYILTDSCNPYKATFTNASKHSKNPASEQFIWDFGDGTSSKGANPGSHAFPAGGTYTVRMIQIDTNACNSPDTSSQVIAFNPISVKAGYDNTPLVCVGHDIEFTNTSTDAQTYKWVFEDTVISNLVNPTYRFKKAGVSRVKLLAYNPKACNQVDSISKLFNIQPAPIADFTFSPQIPQTNVPITFTNKSTGADVSNWDFGDKTGSFETNPEHFYKRTGAYKVCLVVSNTLGCSDTVCKVVEADVHPLADIPTGFSPNGDGNNDILYVRGAAIETIHLQIYNRWGQKVFESNDIANGWDGNYKNKPQEMDAYAFSLDVWFVDGTSLHKKGNVTLLR